jgi:hypothetical protein
MSTGPKKQGVRVSLAGGSIDNYVGSLRLSPREFLIFFGYSRHWAGSKRAFCPVSRHESDKKLE